MLRSFLGRNWLRFLGIGLLAFLLWRADIGRLFGIFGQVSLPLLALAIALNIPQISLKAIRWRMLLRTMNVRYEMRSAVLAYFGSIFIGLLTPGRLGEFVKALHVMEDKGISGGRAWASVIGDRLFDLLLLLLIGVAALVSLTFVPLGSVVLIVALTALLILGFFYLFVHDKGFGFVQEAVSQRLPFTRVLFSPGGWLVELRDGLRLLSPPKLMVPSILTLAAYGVFLGQSYLLALALNLPIGIVQVGYAVALGSLVTLLPISISGLGTREATIIAYLGTSGVSAESGLVFSLLLFLTFYIAGGLMGAAAWWKKPVKIDGIRVLDGGKKVFLRLTASKSQHS